MTNSKRQGLFVIPSGVEESLDPVIERCLDFARHDSEYWLRRSRIRPYFVIRHSCFLTDLIDITASLQRMDCAVSLRLPSSPGRVLGK